ncbi:hypothetical protein GLOIN_2v1772162 [Rhizophagus irregularis DAOM 181602=DAOM 197198]|uniref:Crinkler effector protein N-terminal domain-containing protein n=2 Tax=Rhizophagus irregularis TaxID=588596 RepID=A0A2P4Q838_RHIID|nr:hypothetical protein GLOIN_2v1772162 [Rhizophagus irregularis DAOM 181602=DAOM 197198]POG73797.1 hypothetical protein GLOIN_2v1772162 [Rhizophagus irregularis DAOM 181602=DAOM 197198]|eukprot:XP_025180663.1 hypothetical protein GLOIN_2v1772162 [Rhizophagus irregularis DAOM 181602=DAOM 197198]
MVGCFILGSGIVFNFEIGRYRDFTQLKKAIWEEDKEYFERDGITNEKRFKLWKVQISTKNNNKYDKLLENHHEDLDVKEDFGGERLDETWRIDSIFKCPPPEEHIHIMVQPPPPATTGKRKADDLDLDETNISKKEKLIDLSSPESIVRFFTEDDENKKWIKTDFAKPLKLCNNKFNFEREGRDDALYQVYDYIYDRHCKISNAKSPGAKELHPLFALQSAPGGGKSFFFDELASLKDEDISRYLEKKHSERINNENLKEVISIIRNSISICITYNGGSPYNGGDIRKGLIMRILWSYFFDENKLTWSVFCKKFGKCFVSLDTYTAIDSIIHHSGKSVLLCIDETMRVLPKGHGDLENIKTLLNELYRPYRDFSRLANKFYFVISTLDTLNVWSTQTDSQRPICWIPLRRLVLSESANLFRTLVRNLDEHRLFVIKKCISDCNGHPRTLEKFYQVINVENGDDTTLNTDNYSSLMERLARNLKQLLGRISLPIVKIALFGKEKSLTDEIETKAGKSNLRDLISSGIYINSLTDEGEIFSVIPTLSPVSLQYFCIYNKDSESEEITAIAKILRRLLTTESSFDEEVMDGKPFEKFHTNWELLYRALQENGKNVSLRNIYDLPDENWKKIEIQLQRKEIAYCHNKIEFPPDGNIYDTNQNTFENLVDYIFVPKKSNNSGFDMVIFEKKSDGSGYIAINLECRFSYPNKKTTLESKEISEKYEHMKSKYLMHVKYLSGTRNNVRWEYGRFYDKSAVGKLKMSENDIYLVFVIWRNIGNLGNDILDNENIIIVNRDNLKKIYTPSLVTRPQFYSDELQKIKDIRYEN